MDINDRITQFENMAASDPDNDMAHFSLGGAYAQADRHDDAARTFLRCVQVNPEMSKAYQLAAESLLKTGDQDRAASTLTKGYEVATMRGDLLPKKAMAAMLEELGRPIPEIEDAPAAETPAGQFICNQTGRPGTQLDRPPFKGPIGQWIYENISAQTWQAWIGQGTKVINELQLDLSSDEGSAMYDQHMYEFLGIDESLLTSLTS
jgi:Fe-S cluster biosynthesis and repair protein YggX